ncbi:inverse autotransporter beta domain-containing protein, partial [Desulfovibrio litoralis]
NEKASVASKGEKTKTLVASDNAVTPSDSPKKVSAVLFNAATNAMGLPGLDARNDAYDPNADQGLGFHADGTVRKAGGENSYDYSGKRAAAYMNNGVNTGSYNGVGTNLELDPIAKFNNHYFNSAKGGRSLNAQNGGTARELDPAQVMIDRSLNYGVGMVNSAAEGVFLGVMEGPYGGAKARFNFMADWDGKINGEGDLLLPWYDSKHTTVYSQLGTRSMNAEDSKDRWIGNFGVGQRWYPLAQKEGIGEDAGNLMLGYNTFYDHDFTRSHQRGGLGVEAQYDWIHLASNYYAPLSNWKDSKDFDGDFVQERPAEGWDLRTKGYVPFYRNVALTGSYTQWKGDHVGMFGASKLESDPNVWSYGVEYTPVPLVSGFVNQRSTERGSSDTEVGMRFTYNFNMPWEDQISHSKVAEMRTVGGSRHEFVDRENKMVLEYKAKDNYHVEYLGKVGINQFKFGIRNGFDKYVAGQQVRVSVASGASITTIASVEPSSFFAKTFDYLDKFFSVSAAYAAENSVICESNAQGEFIIQLANVTETPVMLTIQAGNSSQSVTLNDVTVTSGTLTSASASLANSQTTTMTFTGPANTNVTWSVVSGPGTLSAQTHTNGSGVATATLTATGIGPASIQVSATANGKTATATVQVQADGLAITANPTSMQVGETKSITFTLTDSNGLSVNSQPITSFVATGTGEVEPYTAPTASNGSGAFTLSLKGQTQGAVKLTVTLADGRSAFVDVTVIAESPVTTLTLAQGTYYHTASATVTSDEAGTGFYILQESTQTPPSVSDVFASATNVSLINGSSTINFNNLKYSTAYTLYFVATDGTTPQTVVSSTSLTTANLPTGYVDFNDLIWRPIDSNTLTWNDANTACTTQTINGQTGWRLPSKQELLDLFNSGRMIGQGWALGSAWSSDAGGPGKHWSFSLSGGFGSAYSDTAYRVVSCVR